MILYTKVPIRELNCPLSHPVGVLPQLDPTVYRLKRQYSDSHRKGGIREMHNIERGLNKLAFFPIMQSFHHVHTD